MYIMKVMTLTWEYPPRNVGGISPHVYNLYQEIAALGHEVHVITCQEGLASAEENDCGVYVHRVFPDNLHTEDFTKWVMHLNYAFIQEAIRLIEVQGNFDVIHAHDWLCAHSAKVLKCAYRTPLICTIHSTEHGRNNGIRTDMQHYISQIEWMLCYEAWKIITCSYSMRQEVNDIFHPAWEKIWVIPNGVEKVPDLTFDKKAFRNEYASDNEKIALFVGRHVFEKGLHILVEAAKEIDNRIGNVKFIIVGTGPITEEIKDRVRYCGMENKFIFTGYVDQNTKNKLYKIADAAVFPSLYEPFGIVALEAMESGCPVVVSDVGGLGEIIQHKQNGLKAYAGLANSLADNIIELLSNVDLANDLKANALQVVKDKYSWDRIAKLTCKLYEEVKAEEKKSAWI